MTQIWSELRRRKSTEMFLKNRISAAFQICENQEVLQVEEI